MNILLIGEHFSKNLGDGVISQTVEGLLRINFNEVRSISFLDMNGKKNYSNIGINFYEKNKLKVVIKKIIPAVIHERLSYKYQTIPNYSIESGYDIAIYTGGQLIMPYFIKKMKKINNILRNNEIPIAYNSVGYGEFHSKKIRNQASKLISDRLVKHISVRDGEKKFESMKISNTIYTSVDNAIYSSDIFKVTKNKESKIIGLGIMYIERDKKALISFWQETIFILEEKELNWKFFVNGSNEDYQFAQEILKNHGFSDTIDYLLPQPKTPKDLLNIVSQFEKIISFRLHSHIIAYSLEIPTIAMVWDEKINSFFQKIAHEDRCYDYKFYDSNLLLDMLDSLYFSDEDMRKKKLLQIEIMNNLKKIIGYVRDEGIELNE